MTGEIRARIAQIASDNYSDEYGLPADGTFEKIADAIIAEFEITGRRER